MIQKDFFKKTYQCKYEKKEEDYKQSNNPASQIAQKEHNLSVTFWILRRYFGSFYVMKDVKSHTQLLIFIGFSRCKIYVIILNKFMPKMRIFIYSIPKLMQYLMHADRPSLSRHGTLSELHPFIQKCGSIQRKHKALNIYESYKSYIKLFDRKFSAFS